MAVKLLTEMTLETAAALWKEARTMQDFSHDNVVRMFGVANDAIVSGEREREGEKERERERDALFSHSPS